MLKETMRSVLTIAGFDPSSGAGVTADLMVFAAHGLFGISCITSLTVQSTVGVKTATAVPVAIVRETLECLQNDLPPVGIKIGMLATAATVRTVAEFLESLRGRNRLVTVVLDPVLRSSSGRELLDTQGVEVLRERLLPVVDWVTPNLEELGVLSTRHFKRREDIPQAALALQGMGSRLNVVVTGGHMSPPDDLLLRAGEREALWLPGEMIASRSTHGTGCAFSSALLSRLVLGDTAQDAATRAKRYVSEAIRTATPMGKGWGPVNHLWPLQAD
jgi:hydroxymethylpyrimidine/phosphomethylpyrimidine kinase